MGELTLPQQIAASILPLLFGITMHEVAHGWAAKLLGDSTAQRLGRLSLNPLKHIDPVGTVLVPLALLIVTGRAIGWAKPVPVTQENLRHPRRDMALVAVAGPLANLLMAVLWALIAKGATALPEDLSWAAQPLEFMGYAGIVINVVLMVLNLLPIPPLDGGQILMSLLPGRLSWKFGRIEPYAFIIVIALLYFRVLDAVLAPVATSLGGLIVKLAGLV